MPLYKVAHLREQGQDIIVVPLDRSFELKLEQDKNEIIINLQLHARGAKLAGLVIPVWDAGDGQLKFIAPQQWHAFFRSLNWTFVQANLNTTISW